MFGGFFSKIFDGSIFGKVRSSEVHKVGEALEGLHSAKKGEVPENAAGRLAQDEAKAALLRRQSGSATLAPHVDAAGQVTGQTRDV